MPRKKRGRFEGVNSQTEEEEEEKELNTGRKKHGDKTMCIVISDSEEEGENNEEKNMDRKKGRRERERGKLLAKRRLAQMSEEEQLALAVQMSRQEASQLNSKEDEEEELLRKAIAESLHSCQSSPLSTRKASLPRKDSKSEAVQLVEKVQASAALGRDWVTAHSSNSQEEPDSDSQSLSQDIRSASSRLSPGQNPRVVLAKLSQELLPNSAEHCVLPPNLVMSPTRDHSIGCGPSPVQTPRAVRAKLSQELFPSSSESDFVLPPSVFTSPTKDQSIGDGLSPVQNPRVVLEKLSQESLLSSPESDFVVPPTVFTSPTRDQSIGDGLSPAQNPRVVLEKLSQESLLSSPKSGFVLPPTVFTSPTRDQSIGDGLSPAQNPRVVLEKLSQESLLSSPESDFVLPPTVFTSPTRDQSIGDRLSPIQNPRVVLEKLSQESLLSSSESGLVSPPPSVVSPTKDQSVGDVQSPVQNPRVVLEKLSQELLPSSSTRDLSLSPLKKMSPAQVKSNSKVSLNMSPVKVSFSLSPKFLKKSPPSRHILPRKLFVEQDKEMSEEGSADEEKSSGSSKKSKKVAHCHGLESPGSASEPELKGNKRTRKSGTQSSKHGVPHKNSDCAEGNTTSLSQCGNLNVKSQITSMEKEEEEDGGTVHYHWGIPFCPKGVDPDQYTKVILCQFEVYEKSLKQAQRLLLCKAKIGEPILPAPAISRLRRSDRGKTDQAFREGKEEVAEVRDSDSDGEGVPAAEEEVRTIRCHVSCESDALLESISTELKVDEKPASEDEPTTSQHQFSQPLIEEETPEVEKSTPSVLNWESVGRNKRDSSTIANSSSEKQEEEILVCPETQQSPHGVEEEEEKEESATIDLPTQAATDVTIMGDDNDTHNTTEVRDLTRECVECPLCGQSFPPAKIELHAAYCNDVGDQEDSEENLVVTRSYRGRKSEATSSNGLVPTEIGKVIFSVDVQ